MNRYRQHLYKANWTLVYKQLQDAIFFTRAEVFPTDFSTPNCLKLHISWYTYDNVHETYEISLPYDKDFPEGFPG